MSRQSKLFAHEVGHYIGLGHTFGKTIKKNGFSDPVDILIAYLKAKNSKDPNILDGDRSRFVTRRQTSARRSSSRKD